MTIKLIEPILWTTICVVGIYIGLVEILVEKYCPEDKPRLSLSTLLLLLISILLMAELCYHATIKILNIFSGESFLFY
ncbi:MAG: hypothetical protein WC855_09085 [Thermodesulfovibrionales bacterium]